MKNKLLKLFGVFFSSIMFCFIAHSQVTIQQLPRASAMNLHAQTYFEIEDFSLSSSQASRSLSWDVILMSLDVRYIQGVGTPTLDANFVLTIPITGKTDLTVDLSPLREGLSGGGTGAESFADLTGQISAGQIPNDIITQLMLSPNLVSVLNSFLNEGAVDARIRSADNVGSETEYGVFQKASITDATSGTSTAKVLTPSTLVNSINSNGRIKEEIEDNTETLLANPKPSDKGAIHSTWLGNSPSDGGTSYDDTELRGRVTQNETDITDLRGRVTTLENEPDPIDTNTHNNDFRAVADSNARGDLTEDDVTLGGIVLQSDRGEFLTPYDASGTIAFRPFFFGRPHFISGTPSIVIEGDFAVVDDKVYFAKATDSSVTTSTDFSVSTWVDLTKDNDTIYDDTDLKGRVTDLETEVSSFHRLGSLIDSIYTFFTTRWAERHTSTTRIDIPQGYSNVFDYRSGSSAYLEDGITFDDTQDAIVLPTNSLIRVVSAEWTSLDNHETIAFRNSSGQDVPFVRLEGGVLQYNSSGSRTGINWVNAEIPPLGTQVRPNIGDTLILQVRPSGSGIRVVPVIKLTQGTTSANDDVFEQLDDFNISNADPDLTRWEFRGVTNYKGFDPDQSLSHVQLQDLLRDHIEEMWAFGKARLLETDTVVDQWKTKVNLQNNAQIEGTELPDYIRSIAGDGSGGGGSGVTLEQVNSAIQSAVEDYALSGSPNAKIPDLRLNRPLTEVYQKILDQFTYTSSDNIEVSFSTLSVPYSSSTGVIRSIDVNNEQVTFDGTQGDVTHIQFIEGGSTLEYPLTLSSGNLYSIGESDDGNFPVDDLGTSVQYEVKIRTATGFLTLSSLAVASSHVDISNAIGLPSLTKENLRTILESGSSSTGLAYSSLRGTPTVPTRWINDVTLSGSTFTFDVIGGSDRILTVPDNDTLSGLSCATGEIAKYSGSSWFCARDEIGTDTNTDTLGDLSCSTNQIAQYNGTAWVCVDTPSGGGGGTSFTPSEVDVYSNSSGTEADIILPTDYQDYDYVYVAASINYTVTSTGFDVSSQMFPVSLLTMIGSVTGGRIRNQGNNDFSFNSTTRALNTNPAAQRIFIVKLIRLFP